MKANEDNSADISPAISEAANGTIVEVWVVPGASRTEVVGIHGDALRIRVSAPAAGGRANRAVTRVLGEIAGADVHLLKGHRGRQKRFLIEGISPAEFAGRYSRQ